MPRQEPANQAGATVARPDPGSFFAQLAAWIKAWKELLTGIAVIAAALTLSFNYFATSSQLQRVHTLLDLRIQQLQIKVDLDRASEQAQELEYRIERIRDSDDAGQPDRIRERIRLQDQLRQKRQEQAGLFERFQGLGQELPTEGP